MTVVKGYNLNFPYFNDNGVIKYQYGRIKKQHYNNKIMITIYTQVLKIFLLCDQY